jgi:enterochelin esterase-like enzyme
VKWVNPNIKEMPGLSHHILASKAMGHDVGYVVWTPPDYSKQVNKRYPVIYFLHGAGGNETSDAGGFSSWVAKAISDGLLPPHSIVDVQDMIVFAEYSWRNSRLLKLWSRLYLVYSSHPQK